MLELAGRLLLRRLERGSGRRDLGGGGRCGLLERGCCLRAGAVRVGGRQLAGLAGLGRGARLLLRQLGRRLRAHLLDLCGGLCLGLCDGGGSVRPSPLQLGRGGLARLLQLGGQPRAGRLQRADALADPGQRGVALADLAAGLGTGGVELRHERLRVLLGGLDERRLLLVRRLTQAGLARRRLVEDRSQAPLVRLGELLLADRDGLARGLELRVAPPHLGAGGLELVLALRGACEGRLQPALEVGGPLARGIDLGGALRALLARGLERLVASRGLEGERLELRLQLVDGRHAGGQLGDALLELARSPRLLERGVQLDLEPRRTRAQRLQLGHAALERGAQLRGLLDGALRCDALLALGRDGLARRLGGLLGCLHGGAQLKQLALGVARLGGDLVAVRGERPGGGLRVRGAPLGQLAGGRLLLVERLGVSQIAARGGEL